MRFVSTRGGDTVGLSAAIGAGLAPDGGLYVPCEWPAAAARDFPAFGDGELRAQTLAQLGAQFLAPFAAGDALAAHLAHITAEAFDFAAPLRVLRPGGLADGAGHGAQRASPGQALVLELFHGPTAAFKDFGARFLAAVLARTRLGPVTQPLRILVATSGDTGGAVAAAFHRRAGLEVVVLFPKGQVSPTQQQQLTCWGENVQSFAVRGSFDDCQRLVKQAFADPLMRAQAQMSSANSINLGRLLPQAVYYVAASLAVQARHGAPASFVIPSGNLGNATACLWARRCGAPIGEIVLAHNANRTVPDYLADGTLRLRPSVSTLASAMDVGSPSNLERMTALHPDFASLQAAVTADSVDDAAIRERIRADYQRYGVIWCPHSAVAAEVFARLPAARRERAPWVLVATAHPAKFREVIEPLIGRSVPIPANLARLFERPAQFMEIEASIEALRAALEPQGAPAAGRQQAGRTRLGAP